MRRYIFFLYLYTDLESLPNILQKKYALLRDLDQSLQGMLILSISDVELVFYNGFIFLIYFSSFFSTIFLSWFFFLFN